MSNEFKALYGGKWTIDENLGTSIECYVMPDKSRVLSLRGTSRSMGLKGNGSQALIRNLKANYLREYLSQPLKDWLEKAESDKLPNYVGTNGRKFTPFEADLFVDLCKAYTEARNAGALKLESQAETADRLFKIMSAFAKVGIVAIIDEVTGYQEDRDRDELQQLLAKYIRAEFMPWTKRFPDEFYKEMFRLKGWTYRGNQKPGIVGHITNQLVYEQLPDGVLDELRSKNPVNERTGRRSRKYHQFLTVDTGVPHLDKHIASVITLMNISDDWDQFIKFFNKKFNLEQQIDFDDVIPQEV